MTGELFRTEAYLRDAPARVAAHTPEGGVILDNSLFYPTGGGQPGDSGWLTWDKQELSIATTVRARAVIEPWTISIMAGVLIWTSHRWLRGGGAVPSAAAVPGSRTRTTRFQSR